MSQVANSLENQGRRAGWALGGVCMYRPSSLVSGRPSAPSTSLVPAANPELPPTSHYCPALPPRPWNPSPFWSNTEERGGFFLLERLALLTSSLAQLAVEAPGSQDEILQRRIWATVLSDHRPSRQVPLIPDDTSRLQLILLPRWGTYLQGAVLRPVLLLWRYFVKQ